MILFFSLYPFFFFLLIVSTVFCEESPIVSLDVDSYHSVINENSDIIIKHYTNFCIHCKNLEPIYLEVAEEIKKKHPNVIVAEIDLQENPKIGRELNLQGFPFICYYKNGKRIDFSKERTKETILDFIESNLNSSSDISSENLFQEKAAVIQDTINRSDYVVVLFYPETETYLLSLIDTAISEIEQTTRIHVFEKEVASILDVPYPSIMLYQKNQEKKQYRGEMSMPSIRRWILREELPLIVPYTPTYSKKVFHKDISISVHVMLFVPSSLPAPSKGIAERLAKTYHNRLIVLHIPAENHLLLDYFGVKEWELPTIGIVHYADEGQKKYLLRQPFTFDNANAFIQQFYKGELNAILRSEEEPVENRGPVYKVVGTTFENVVFDPTKDVVVKFYASWCGKSKDFEPIYEEVAMQYMRDRSILFTEFEATKNEVAGITVNEFPTVIMYKAGGNGRSAIYYTGNRESDDFKTFIQENHGGEGESDEL